MSEFLKTQYKDWTEAEFDAVRAEVAAHIAAEGAFHIGKVVGLFECCAPTE